MYMFSPKKFGEINDESTGAQMRVNLHCPLQTIIKMPADGR